MLVVVLMVLISTVSGVILPKMSTSKEMCDLIKLMVPFLMAMTFPSWIRAAFYPLKKALAQPVSSATTALMISTLDWVWDLSTETTLTYTLYPLLAFDKSLTLTN
jgi:hypothetical protein